MIPTPQTPQDWAGFCVGVFLGYPLGYVVIAWVTS